MLARVNSFVLQGIDGVPCEVEVDLDEAALERQTMVGLPDQAVKESIERVRAAMTNCGYAFPKARLLIALAPADLRKEGPIYDLPIAIGMLTASGVIRRGATGVNAVRTLGRTSALARATLADGEGRNGAGPALGASSGGMHAGGWTVSADPSGAPDVRGAPDVIVAPGRTGAAGTGAEGLDLRRYLVAGELALDGRVRPIRGVIAMAALALSRGARGVIVPAENAPEGSVVEGIESIGVSTLPEVVGLLNGQLEAAPAPALDVAGMLEEARAPVDFAEVRGQEPVKRAIVIAAAGGHNILMLGPAGSGKTMMAKALPGVLPPLTPAEAVEVTRIYSAAGMLPPGRGLVTVRPVRTPHHTASSAAVVGGGIVPRPGEISLAHRGVLFLDELPEFPRFVLETLRQPMEDHVVTIARSHSAVRFPASFMLVAAMNPTMRGDALPGEAGREASDRYIGRLSGPLIDRIDLHVEAPAVAWSELSSGGTGTSSAAMRERVLGARRRQEERQGPTLLNARLAGRQLDTFAPTAPRARARLGEALTELGLSARAYDKIRRVARTIADLEGCEGIEERHVLEAVQFRLLDRRR